MADWNNWPFLQALGWATLNNIWQIALLWCCFLLIQHFIKLSSTRKYLFSVYSVFIGFAWFMYTFSVYYFYEKASLSLEFSFIQSVEFLPIVLTSASIAYLCLLIFPAYRIFRNWKFIQKIKKEGLEKASSCHRLFVQKVAQQLGIRKPVKVYLSQLVMSPVTVGFIKPVILLPFAAISNLSLQQVEAVLLHELSHIRRHDYLVNLLLSTIHVVLYFNPFVKLFLKKIELERESCCDEMVLQFEYDKLSYASALLELEKSSQQTLPLAMAAANKNHLLYRIEKIVGIKRKPVLKTTHFAGAFAALLLLMIINTVIIAEKHKLPSSFSINNFSQPSSLFVNEGGMDNKNVHLKTGANTVGYALSGRPHQEPVIQAAAQMEQIDVTAWEVPENDDFVQVAFDEDAHLNHEEEEQVNKTVQNTKKVLEVQWKEVEEAIADGMTAREKRAAKRDYLKEIEKIDWKSIEHNLKISYEAIDWNKINATVDAVMFEAKLDSIKTCYEQTLTEINRLNTCTKLQELPIPDVSEQELQQTRETIKSRISQIKNVRTKKVVRL